MPNGRRGPDWASDFARDLIKAVEKSKKWHFLQKHGATTCWEGEERVEFYTMDKEYIEHKGERDKRRKIFVWISEYNVWKGDDNRRETLKRIKDFMDGISK